jgi:PAS domain-containing protein
MAKLDAPDPGTIAAADLAVGAIYAAAAEPERWPQALQAIADCFDDAGAILIYGRDDGAFGVIESPAVTPLMREYAGEWSRRDIRALRCRERGYFLARDVVTDRDVLTDDEIETDPFYTEFLAKYDFKYFAAAMVSPDPRVEVGMSVQRRRGKAPYSESELELIRRLGRHVEQALRISIRLLDAELSNVGLRDALSRLGIGVFALDSLGRVVFSNPAAARVLDKGLFVENGRLRVGRSGPRHEAEAALAHALESGSPALIADPKPFLIERTGFTRPLVMYVLPVGTTGSQQEFLTHVRAIALVIDPQAQELPDPSVVRDVLGLTLAEAVSPRWSAQG